MTIDSMSEMKVTLLRALEKTADIADDIASRYPDDADLFSAFSKQLRITSNLVQQVEFSIPS